MANAVPVFSVGLDLGQAADPTALVVLEAVPSPPSDRGRSYQVPYLQRFPLGTWYPKIVGEVKALLAQPPLAGNAVLVVDGTGVGRAVVDLFRTAGGAPASVPRLVAVTITGGNAASYDPATGSFHVPKRDLVGAVQVLLGTGRLKIGQSLPEAELLIRELLNFQVKVTDAGRDTYGTWRENQHDDLVLALAVAAWLAEQPVPRIGTATVTIGGGYGGGYGYGYGSGSGPGGGDSLLAEHRRLWWRRQAGKGIRWRGA